MNENRSNVALFCTKHSPKPMGIGKTDPQTLVGAHVKVFLVVPKATRERERISREHVWVKVTSVAGAGRDLRLVGYIDNQPVFATQYKYGQEVRVNPKHVEQVLPSHVKEAACQ